jgi:hypothetical protein
MDFQKRLSTHEKALQINLASKKYGTIAEIGAGQEVARWFFHVGGASGLIAKTISAYDMTFSDAIYGPSVRYVSRQRLQTMLDYEYQLVVERLGQKRGTTTSFFAFSNTVAARSYSNQGEGQGWMGVKFQSSPGKEPSSIIIHIELHDHENVREQEALGIMGVNLIYGSFFLSHQPEILLSSLMDGLTRDRLEVDMIKFSGADFTSVDNRLMSLSLVRQQLTDAAMFTSHGEVVQAAEILYKKPILIERGSFRPVTHVAVDMLSCAESLFRQEPGVQAEDAAVIMEMTMHNLLSSGEINPADFLARVDVLAALGKTVMISNYGEYYHLAEFLGQYSKKPMAIALGIPSLKELFDEEYYRGLEGGILESLGRLFRNGLKLYVYPLKDLATGKITTAKTIEMPPHLRHLYLHLIENRHIECIETYCEDYLHIFPRDVLSRIQIGDRSWEKMAPSIVVQMIKDRKYFGYRENPVDDESVV